jgi:predicted PurR-regulated permease PerM
LSRRCARGKVSDFFSPILPQMIPPGPPDEPVPVPAAPAAAPLRALRLAHYLWIFGTVLVIAGMLHWLGPILTPFLIGTMLAYLGNPAVNWGQRRKVPRTVGTLLVMALIFVVLLALLLVLSPLVQSEFMQLSKRLPELLASGYASVAPWLNDRFGIEVHLDMPALRKLVAQNVASANDLYIRLLHGIRAGGTMLLTIVINLVLIPVVMFYLLRDWNVIVRRVGELMPRRWFAKARTIAIEIDDILAEFIRGQLWVMFTLAVYYAIGLSVAGLQFAVPIGILTGLLVFVPYVGFGLGLVLGVIAALLQFTGWPGFIAVLAVYGIGQLLEGYVLIPWLVGDRIGLHPLAVIFALLAFGQLFGFAGVLFALPASAALLVGLRHLRALYQDSDLYQ